MSNFICEEISSTKHNQHLNFNTNGYIGSKKHKENTKIAREKALGTKIQCQHCNENKTKGNIEKHVKSCFYNPINYNECVICKLHIRKDLKFCGSSCAAIYNNSIRTSESREKQRKTLLIKNNKPLTQKRRKPKTGNGISRKVSFPICLSCLKLFIVKTWSKNHRKTCSPECEQDLKSFTSIKTKRYTYKGVNMQSNWEVQIAILLDELKIDWIRPKHIKWTDESDKERKYFPDFYLPDFNIYIDPKNPYVQTLDKYKIEQIQKEVNLYVGILEECVQYIKNLVSMSGAAPDSPVSKTGINLTLTPRR